MPSPDPALQRWNGVVRPSNAAVPFGPVEAAGASILPSRPRPRRVWLNVAFEEHPPRIPLAPEAGDDEEALAPLRKTEGQRVDLAVCPRVAES